MQLGDDPCKDASTGYDGLPALSSLAASRLDKERWDHHVNRLTQARGTASGNRGAAVIERAIRAAAADTGAIEGLYTISPGVTLQVAEQRGDWRTALAEGGDKANALFDAQLASYHHAVDLANTATGITEAHVRQLHAEIRRPEELNEEELGRYKLRDNCVQTTFGQIHRYARAADVGPELAKLISESRTENFNVCHPVVQAAFIHFGLAAIHPFSDGNGRVARAIASAVLQHAIGLPLLVYADQRQGYLTSLEAWDAGDPDPFIQFLFDRTLDSIRFVTDGLLVPDAPTADDFHRLYLSHAGLTVQEENTLAVEVLNRAHAEIGALASRLTPTSVGGFAQSMSQGMNVADAFRGKYRGAQQDMATLSSEIRWNTAAPASANVALRLAVAIAKDPDERYIFAIYDLDSPQDQLEIRLDDVRPAESSDFLMRRAVYLERKVSEALGRLLDEAKHSAEASRKIG